MANIQNPGDFPSPQEQPTIREVELGEWFNPFEGFEDIPSKSPHSKYVPFNVRGVGKFETAALQMGKGYATRKRTAIVMYPDKDSQLDTDDLKKLEVETVQISATSLEDKYQDDPPVGLPEIPYDLELRSPIGNSYKASFDSIFSTLALAPDEPKLVRHAQEFGENRSLILAPQTEFVLGKVEIRIVPEAGDQK